MVFQRLIPLIMVAVVSAITIMAYLPGMSAGFYFDDEPNLLRADALHWREFNLTTIERTVRDAVKPSRPLANLSLGLNHLFSGLNPAPYHWTNLFIHLLVGLALYLIIRLLQARHAESLHNRWISILTVLLFLVHPLNIQAVTYVVQRMTSLSALFFLLSMGSYLKGRYHVETLSRYSWYGASLVCLSLSIASKETGYLLVPVLLLYEWCFNHQEWRAYKRRIEPLIDRKVLYSLVFVAAGLALTVVWWMFGDKIGWLQTFPSREFSGYERVLTQSRVQFFYLSLFLLPLPSRLNLDHAFTVSHSLFDPPSTILALMLLIAIVVIGLRVRRHRPLIAFPILGYLLLHSMESGPVNLELVFEHRMYLPTTMIVLFIALNFRQLPYRGKALGYTLLSIAVLALALSTYQRNRVWGTPIAFFRDCAQKSPTKFRPQYNLGTELGRRGNYEEAKEVLTHAIRLRPQHSQAHNQLANVYMMMGERDTAEKHYQIAVESDQRNAEALFNLANVYAQQGRYAEQRKMLELFVEHAPPYLAEHKRSAIIVLKRYRQTQ